jgi:hypothetical protein
LLQHFLVAEAGGQASVIARLVVDDVPEGLYLGDDQDLSFVWE